MMQEIITYFLDMPLLELTAVALALVYVIFAAQANRWCWPAAFVSTALYSYIFYDVTLFMDSLLNVYYLVMAVYGWYCWQGTEPAEQGSLPQHIISWRLALHVQVIVLLTLVSLGFGWLMAHYTVASFPYLDSATTVFSVFATYLVAQKVLENWLYWVAIDAVSIYLYVEKSLLPTAVLFVLYVIIALYGYVHWRKGLQQQHDDTAAQENYCPE